MEGDDNSESELYETHPKKMKTEWSKSYSNKAMQMMKKMGYENDKGLGKQNQGRLEPIMAYSQDGRRGLGLKLEEIESGNELEWDPDSEEICIPEVVDWLKNKHNLKYDLQNMEEWIQLGERKDTLDGETYFVEPEILSAILESKCVFDHINENDLRRARSRSNPYETIRGSIFQNRAAVKMANIDSMLDFMFTDPRDEAGQSLIDRNDLLYFADICAGPGGFSEYILYKKGWEAKGFGFTLRGPNDFKLDKFFAGSPESFDAHYGVEDDGDVYVDANQNSFADYIFKHSSEGVHFVMADGGFSVEGQENIQEILSKQLYLCQCLTALKILRKNGSFVCKLFDIFTPFSVGLVYLMFLSFEEISIIKPNSSRPANSERYLVCKWKKQDTSVVCTYLNMINRFLNEYKSQQDIVGIVDFDIMSQDEEFIRYITESNNLIGRNQIIGLRKIAAFCRNPKLKEQRQSEIRKKCLELWQLPDKLRQAPENKSVEKYLEEILLSSNWYENKAWLNTNATELLSMEILPKRIESIHDWYFVPIGRGETSLNTCSFFMCTTRGKFMRYTDTKKWEPIEYAFEVSPKSLVYGELVFEYSGEGRTQTRICGLHIIDAITLGGKDVRRLPLAERIAMCKKFAKSLNKPFKKENNYGTIRCKQLYQLADMEYFFKDMRHYALKDNALRLGISLDESGTKFFVPGGILLLCEICHSFMSLISKSQNMLYYYDKEEKKSYFKNNMPPERQHALYASFRNSFVRRLLWKWTNTHQVDEQLNKVDESVLYRCDFVQFISNKQHA